MTIKKLIKTSFNIMIINANGGAWLANATTLTDARREAIHMAEAWWHHNGNFELTIKEVCLECNGSGITYSKKMYLKVCPECKNKFVDIKHLDYKPLTTVVHDLKKAVNERFIFLRFRLP